MKRYAIRTLASIPVEQAWEILEGDFIIVFDDGEVVTNAKETIYSNYVWEYFRLYPETPMLKKHHVASVLKGKRLNANTHLSLIGNVMFSVFDQYLGKPTPILHKTGKSRTIAGCVMPGTSILQQDMLLDDLCFIAYGLANWMYNDLSENLEEYVTSLDITDFADVYDFPPIRKANDEIEPTEESIQHVYDTILTNLETAPELANNPIARAVRSKLTNANQVNQCLGPRGYLTDVNNIRFNEPVLTGYYAGFDRFYDSLVESRSAAKSLESAKKQLQDTEYFSRRMQLVTNIVERLHYGDCGTPYHLTWNVRGPEIRNGKQVRASDVDLIAGKYYIADDNSLVRIAKGDYHLIGKTLKLRSALKCMHPDPHGICSTCYGQMSEAIPPGTNMGQINSTSLMAVIVQLVLSTKHFDGSASVESLTVLPKHANFLRANVEESCYHLAETLKGKKVVMTIAGAAAANLVDIRSVSSVEELHIPRVSDIEEIKLSYWDKNVEYSDFIKVSLGRRHASLTYPMLNYIKQRNWELDEAGNYILDLSEYDVNEPILKLPMRHVSMSDHAKAIEDLLESNVKEAHNRDKALSTEAFCVELFDLINERTEVNLAVVEIVQLGEMIVSAEEGDYELPKPDGQSGLGVMSTTMINRSLGSLMAYQGQRDSFGNPLSYIKRMRVDNPFDIHLMPYEVVQSIDGG